jgi:hypothetical protein
MVHVIGGGGGGERGERGGQRGGGRGGQKGGAERRRNDHAHREDARGQTKKGLGATSHPGTDERDGSQRSLRQKESSQLLVQTLVIERACLFYITPFLL